MSLSKPSTFPPSKNSFLVSLKKFHVTTSNRQGYNKIYEFRRSRSFFFELADRRENTNELHLKIHTNDYHMHTTPIRYKSTSSYPNYKYQISTMLSHFFSHQRVLPRRIQQKYFFLIRSKLLDRIRVINTRALNSSHRNTNTKTFFNFTYKRYRFHFGIYVPCNTLYDPYEKIKWNNVPVYPDGYIPDNTSIDTTPDNLPLLTHCCKIPSPFIMSQDRRACVNHQKNFFREKMFTKTNATFSPAIIDKSQNKITHANNLFKVWQSRTIKTIYSRRLGIQFVVKYQANGKNHVLAQGQRYMYRKKYMDFQFSPSSNARTRRKQDARFRRHCNRIFKIRKKDTIGTLEDHLIMAKRSRFLFLETQYIDKPLSHLKYTRNSTLPDPGEYKFYIPFFSFKAKTRDRINRHTTISTTASSSTSATAPTLPSSPLIHTVDNFIPLPPSVHVRDELLQYVPQHPIYNNKKETIYFAPGSVDWFLYINRLGKQAKRTAKIQDDRRSGNIIRKRSSRQRTSEHKYEDRKELLDDLTHFQNEFHNRMSSFRKQPLPEFPPKRTESLHKRWKDFTLEYFDVIPPQKYLYSSHRPVTSDDTKQLELRPNKRDTTTNRNLDSSTSSKQIKKTSDALVPDDTFAAGPSKPTDTVYYF